MATCKALSHPDTVWNFCPAVAPAYLFAILFALITFAHTVQAILHQKLYSLVIIISSAIQTTTYILRVLSIQNATNEGYYTWWFILMMIAPIFTNAYIYMVQGRMVYNFVPSGRTFSLPAWRFGMTFVLADIIAFLVQAAGAIIASGSDTDTASGMDRIMMGLHIYMGGIAFQQTCIFAFLALAMRFHLEMRRQQASEGKRPALTLLYVQYGALGLITVRIIFRLVEYSNGLDSTIPTHEAWQYVFDSTLMMVALVLYNVWHPGRLMPGKEADLPKRKSRKEMKRQGIVHVGRGGCVGAAENKMLVAGSGDEDMEMGRGRAQSFGWK